MCVYYSVSTSSAKSSDDLNVGLLLQLAVTAMGLFTLLAVVIIAVIICRRSSTTVGLCNVFNFINFILPNVPCCTGGTKSKSKTKYNFILAILP